MERLFVIVGRVNSVLLLLVLLGAAGGLAWMMLENNRWQRRGAVEVPEDETSAKKPILLSFERVESIEGANVQMMRLTTQEKLAKFSSGGYGNEIRNILFLTGTEKVARWLFKDHKNLILVASQLREKSVASKDAPTRALYFEYVTTDTNGDGKLSLLDRSHIALTKSDGSGLVEVLQDVSRVLSHDMLDQKYLSVVYQKGSKVRHAKYSVLTMKLESDQEIINVPDKL